MNPEDSMPNAASETVKQTAAVEKQMGAAEAAAAAAVPKPELDNSILAETPTGPIVNAEPKSLSEIAAGPAQVDPTVLKTVAPPQAENAKKVIRPKVKNRTPIFIAIALFVLVFAGFGVWSLVSFLNRDNGGAVAVAERTAFFLENRNGDGTFALFDDTGAKLTDFVYSDKYVFNDAGYAVVRENNDDVAILANNGKLSVPYGKYTNITQAGIFFVAVDSGNNESLILGSGEKIMDVDDYYSISGLVVAISDGESIAYTIKGEKLGKLNKYDNPRDKIATKDVIAINADEHLYIINVSTGDVLLRLEQKEAYDIYDVDDALAVFSLKNVHTEKYDMTIIDGEFHQWDCSNGHIPRVDDGNYVYYHQNGSGLLGQDGPVHRWIMGSDGKKIAADKIIGDIVYFDSEHYAYNPSTDSPMYVMVDGKETIINNVKSLSYLNGQYAVAYSDAPAEIRDKNFNLIRKFPVKSSSISGPDKNGNYILSRSVIVDENNKVKWSLGKNKYYLTVLDNGDYLVDSSLGEKGIIDAKGEEKLKIGEYSEIKIENGVVAAKNASGKYVLFDKDYNVALGDCDVINVRAGYIEITKDGKLQYYTYSDKLFYEG